MTCRHCWKVLCEVLMRVGVDPTLAAQGFGDAIEEEECTVIARTRADLKRC